MGMMLYSSYTTLHMIYPRDKGWLEQCKLSTIVSWSWIKYSHTIAKVEETQIS